MKLILWIILIVFILVAKAISEREKKKATAKPPRQEEGTGGSLRSELERRLKEWEDKAGRLLEENETADGTLTVSPKLPAPETRKAMTTTLHPEVEGTAGASTAMQPKTHEAEEHLEIQVLGETDAASREPLLPSSPQAKAALLRKGIVLKEILDKRY